MGEGGGRIEREEYLGEPLGVGRENIKFLPIPRGEGGPPAGWWAGDWGTGFVPYPEGLVRPGGGGGGGGP